MVGNPYTNYYENTMGAVEAFYGHGLMRNDVYETWQEYCFGDETAMDTTHCTYLYMVVYYEADNVDHYALDFDLCSSDVSWKKHKNHLLNKFKSDDEWDAYSDGTIRDLFKNRKKRKG